MTHEKGNALWFILIAIALLGALTAMLSRSSSTSEDTGDYEQRAIQINEALRFGSSLEQGSSRLTATGCSENDLSFDYDGSGTSGYENSNAPTDNSCHLFEPEGVGLQWKNVPSSLNDGTDWIITSGNTVPELGCDTASATCTELLLLLPSVTDSACLQINNMTGVTNPSGAPPVDADNSIATGKFTGSFAQSAAIDDGSNSFDGKNAGCVDVNGTNYFYYALLKR